MTRLRVFDGFCKAGGAGEGYHRAGCEVVGWDIQPQPRNPHEFHRRDVWDATVEYLRQFDLLHFSPPCQGYTALRHAKGARPPGHHPLWIGRCRELAQRAGRPYVIENVEEAAWDMEDPVLLCGSMFGLRGAAGWLKRHRMFDCSFPIHRPRCLHDSARPVIGVYGGHVRRRAAAHGGRGTSEASWLSGRTHREVASQLMGIDWMSSKELDEAVPPAYTRWVAEEFMLWLGRRGAT